MPSEATREVAPTRGNTPGGQRSPGHWVANEPGPWEDMTGIAWYNLPSGGRSWWRTSRPEGKPIGRCTIHLPSPTTWDASWSSRRGGRQTIGARGVCGSALKLPHRWAGMLSDKWCAEPRSEPDSGNPTVRDRRAALRTVTSTRRWRAGARAQFRARQPHARIDGRELETESRSGHGHRDEQPYGKPCGSNGSATYRRSRPPRQFPTLHRMSSGTYFPPPVRAVEIPKPHGGGTRILGIPNMVIGWRKRWWLEELESEGGEDLSRRLLRISAGTVNVGRDSGMPASGAGRRTG